MTLPRRIRIAVPGALACALLAAASPGGCGRDALTAPSPGADTTITLAPGADVLPFGDPFRLAFLEVRGDSRCPRDVVCIWAGNAVVSVGLTVGSGPTVPSELNTTLDPKSVIYGSYRVTVVGLAPLPVSTVAIPPGDYRATLLVERFGPD